MECCSSLRNFSLRQWLTLFIFSLGNLCKSSGDMLMGPLYPPLAKQKGASSSIYGLVLGTFNLTVMVASVVIGKYLKVIGPKIVYATGLFILGVTNVIFGFLMYEDVKLTFIILSFTVRITASIGAAGFSTTKNCLIAKEFKDNTGSIYAILEIFLGLGMAIGPIIGTVLSEYGGFILPFVTVGGVQILASVISMILLPGEESEDVGQSKEIGFLKALQKPSIMMFCFAAFSASASIGFLDVGLEEHLQDHGISPMGIGLIFMCRGLAFALFSPFLGFLSDEICLPSSVILISGSMSLIGFLLLGPVPFLPLHTSSLLRIVSLLLIGAGGGGELTCAYTGAFRAALSAGFPDSLSTYGLISGLFSASFYLGWFLGPSVGGSVISYVGFSWTCLVLVVLHGLVCVSSSIYVIAKGSWKRTKNQLLGVNSKSYSLLSHNQFYDSIGVYSRLENA